MLSKRRSVITLGQVGLLCLVFPFGRAFFLPLIVYWLLWSGSPAWPGTLPIHAEYLTVRAGATLYAVSTMFLIVGGMLMSVTCERLGYPGLCGLEQYLGAVFLVLAGVPTVYSLWKVIAPEVSAPRWRLLLSLNAGYAVAYCVSQVPAAVASRSQPAVIVGWGIVLYAVAAAAAILAGVFIVGVVTWFALKVAFRAAGLTRVSEA